MSVKQRDLKNSFISTNTDHSDIQPRSFQPKHQQSVTTEPTKDQPALDQSDPDFFPPNDFVSHPYNRKTDSNQTSDFPKNPSFRPDLSSNQPSRNYNQQSFQPSDYQNRQQQRSNTQINPTIQDSWQHQQSGSSQPRQQEIIQPKQYDQWQPRPPDSWSGSQPLKPISDRYQPKPPIDFNRQRNDYFDQTIHPFSSNNLSDQKAKRQQQMGQSPYPMGPPSYPMGQPPSYSMGQSPSYPMGQPPSYPMGPPYQGQSPFPMDSQSSIPFRPVDYNPSNIISALPFLFQLDQDFLPQEIIFLLSEEDNMLVKFRQRVEKDKNKIEKDIDMVQSEIANLLNDLKLQMIQYIDDHYKRYISVFATFKDEIIQFKQQKLEVPPLLLQQPGLQQDMTNCSNKNLIRELEEMRLQNQQTKINQYICELTKARIEKILEISKDLLQLSSSNGNFYNIENGGKSFNQLKQEISSSLITKFSKMSDFIQPLDYLIKPKQESRMVNQSKADSVNQTNQNFFSSGTYPANFNQMSKLEEEHPYLRRYFTIITHLISQQAPQLNYSQPQPPTLPGRQQQDFQLQPPPNKMDNVQPPIFTQSLRPEFSMPFANTANSENTSKFNKPAAQLPSYSQPYKIQQLQQTSNKMQVETHLMRVPKIPESLNLEEIAFYHTTHTQIILCFTQLKENLIATASKDGTIKIWENGIELIELKGSGGGICTMTVIKEQGIPLYLASGSDHGESSVIQVWNIQTFKLARQLSGHNAAVVALLSLDDGATLISGSYDKQLLVWNLEQLVQKLPAHTNAVTCLAANEVKSIVASGGLDGILNVWQVENSQLVADKQLQNQSIVCSMSFLRLQEREMLLTGGKDGKIRLWDIETAEMERVMTANMGAIMEMVIIQDSKAFQVITMSNKDRNLVLTNGETGDNELIDVGEKVEVEFGCAVYPKMELSKQNQLLIINQNGQLLTRFEIKLN